MVSTIALGADHAGYELKEALKGWLINHGFQVLDLGTHSAPKGVWAGTVRWPAATRAKLVVVNAQAVSKGRDGSDQFPVAGQ